MTLTLHRFLLLVSEPSHFTTAPEAGTDAPVRFAVLGDSRDGPATFAALAEQMQASEVDFFVFTGDAVVNGTRWDDGGRGSMPRPPPSPPPRSSSSRGTMSSTTRTSTRSSPRPRARPTRP